ncbi:MAG: hypothetical protein JSV83_03810 [Desulfobacterales bacterium]|nr:MAG: hypothetical protein JSV83_03810 [Desulfobacterales bacterium]
MVAIRLFLSIAPLSMTPLWGYLIAEGYLNFGGGEKDLFLLIPWIFWSLIYAIVFVFFWLRKATIIKTLVWSVCSATGLVFLTWLVMLFWFSGILGTC